MTCAKVWHFVVWLNTTYIAQWTHCVAKGDFELLILLPLPPQCWEVPGIKSRFLCMLSRHCTSWATPPGQMWWVCKSVGSESSSSMEGSRPHPSIQLKALKESSPRFSNKDWTLPQTACAFKMQHQLILGPPGNRPVLLLTSPTITRVSSFVSLSVSQSVCLSLSLFSFSLSFCVCVSHVSLLLCMILCVYPSIPFSSLSPVSPFLPFSLPSLFYLLIFFTHFSLKNPKTVSESGRFLVFGCLDSESLLLLL